MTDEASTPRVNFPELRLLAAMLVFAFGCQRGRVPPDLGSACSEGNLRLADGGCPVICQADHFSCDGEVADVCDPTGGYHLSANTNDNFGKINLKRGHRVVELALRLFF